MSESFAVKRTAKVAEIDDDGEIDLATAKSKHLAIEKEKASMARHSLFGHHRQERFRLR